MPNRVRGLRLTQDNLHRLGVRIEFMAEPMLMELAEIVRDDLKEHVRKDTHRLEENIIIGPVKHYGHRAVVKIGPSVKGWYARFLEFGTRFMGAFPFIRPARSRISAIAKPRMKRTLKKAVKP